MWNSHYMDVHNVTYFTVYMHVCTCTINKLKMTWFNSDEKLWMDDLMGNFLWQELRELAAHHKENDTFPANWGKQPYNTKKNRYRDIVPCEWNYMYTHIYNTYSQYHHVYVWPMKWMPDISSWHYFLLI